MNDESNQGSTSAARIAAFRWSRASAPRWVRRRTQGAFETDDCHPRERLARKLRTKQITAARIGGDVQPCSANDDLPASHVLLAESHRARMIEQSQGQNSRDLYGEIDG